MRAERLHPQPDWIPRHIPTLDGLRGLAIALVLVYHCAPRLARFGLAPAAGWGWTGVNLFFVLSGYLITGIILDGRGRPFFRNFYARRILRIWPVYFLIVPFNYFVMGKANTWSGSGPVWPHFVFFVQNLTPGLTGTLYPSWSVAIEEQFYLVWAPLARWLAPRWQGALLGAALATGWLVREHAGGLTKVNTLLHLDSLAVGCGLALGLRGLAWTRAQWGMAAAVAAAAGAGLMARGGPWLNTGLALGFGGVVLGGILAAARPRSAAARGLSWRPLRYLGTISYGLYLVHLPVFALLGGVDTYLDHRGAGAAGDLLILLLRFSAAVLTASLLWFGLERRVLALKRYFEPARAVRAAS